MKAKIALCSCLLIFGCYKDVEDLGYNILDDDAVVALEVQAHDIKKVGISWDVKVYFTTIYDSLSLEQKNNLEGIQWYRNEKERGILTPTSVGIINDAINQKTCYQFAFKSKAGDYGKRSNTYCITP